MALRGYLRQMRNTKNLSVVAKQAHFTSDNFCHATTDTTVDLIKQQRGYVRVLTGDHLDRQADSG